MLWIYKKSKFGAESYKEFDLPSTPTGRGFKKMGEKDRDLLRVKFYCVYYLAKLEYLFSDHPH